MAADELAQAIDRRRCARQDRVALEMALDVRRELGRRRIPARGILLERAEGDPFQLALELSREAPRVRAAPGGDLARAVGESEQAGGQLRRVLVPHALEERQGRG